LDTYACVTATVRDAATDTVGALLFGEDETADTGSWPVQRSEGLGSV
jgi:hypothetical protein